MSDRTVALFDRIARRYDRLNRLLSIGSDRLWRRRAAGWLQLPPAPRVLDVGSGTGEMADAIARRMAGGKLLRLDPSREMLRIARERWPDSLCLQADGRELPFTDTCFDALTIAFGLRNISQPERFLAEAVRVLKPGGELLILEFGSGGPGLAARSFRSFLRYWVPTAARCFGGHGPAYRYLMASMDDFSRRVATAELCRQQGLKCRRRERWLLGLLEVTLAVKT